MLRFLDEDLVDSNAVRIAPDTFKLDAYLWKACRRAVRKSAYLCDGSINIFPLVNHQAQMIAYGYQDYEANRELRMLRELTQCKNALQFGDVFPDYKEVVICGCNELAVGFADYLAMLGIKISVIGKYWNYFGYDSSCNADFDGRGKLVIFAEGTALQDGDLTWRVRKSVSAEFECIDKIYETNVLEGKIRDTIGNFEDFICRLEGEDEIVILGDGRESQDAYDLFLKHGIDICGFATETKKRKKLLGKEVVSIDEAVTQFHSPIFVECHGHRGALGEEYTEYFDYCGYERNKQFFLLRDYTDIPVSNLIHVLHGKKVVLAGDRRLSRILSRYLHAVENGNISIKCIDMEQMESAEQEEIVCMVVPDCHSRLKDVREKRKLEYAQFLSGLESDNYTEYFVRSRSFTIIDRYLNQGREKYMVPELTPKGILLGKIPQWSGNYFFKGIMDGHPEVLLLPYADFNDNLFWYCVRLAEYESGEILQNFWEMYDKESGTRESDFPDQERFESSLARFLRTRKSFSSQELFVMFHIAYAEMLGREKVSDIHRLVIYWEPHHVARFDFPLLAEWLKDRRTNGQTVELRRNNVVRTGSACARVTEHQLTPVDPFYNMFLDESSWGVQPEDNFVFKLRFEDIKLRPREMLETVCKRMRIAWSDNMLKTTSYGQRLSYRGSTDFDLRPVFNNYADFLSGFDRFRISIACSPYQKRYGYTYENCLNFSRREIQDMFLKPFMFESNGLFEKDRITQLKIYEWIKWQLWDVRKHMVLDDIQPEFEQIQI